jgi:membrane fusion protein (multidrug efflux system)
MRLATSSAAARSESKPGKARPPRLAAVAPHSFALVILLALAASLLGCEDARVSVPSAEPSGPPPVTVEIYEVTPSEIRWEVGLTGQVNAKYLVTITPEISGVVESVAFEEGKPVAEGDALFVLRNAEQSARVREAAARMALARDVYDRTQRLTSEDISSMARRAEAKAGLDEASAALDLARIELDRTRIRAPFDGVMSDTDIAPGAWVEPEVPLASIAAIDQVEVIFTTTEQGAAVARTGQTISVRVAAYPGERFEGEVFYIAPTIDPATRRLILKARLDNADHRLKPGMFANVDVVIAVKEEALVVPESAMVYDRNGTYVWRVGEGSLAEKVPVSIGLRQHGNVEVTSGLAPGDRVVAAGVHKVMAGQKLEAAEPMAAREEAAAGPLGRRDPEASGAPRAES